MTRWSANSLYSSISQQMHNRVNCWAIFAASLRDEIHSPLSNSFRSGGTSGSGSRTTLIPATAILPHDNVHLSPFFAAIRKVFAGVGAAAFLRSSAARVTASLISSMFFKSSARCQPGLN